MSVWDDDDVAEADADKQFTRICTGQSADDHWACGCIVNHARKVMEHWTGTNCTWVDDDITALGILANEAIKAGLYKTAPIPPTMIAEIEKKMAEDATVLSDAD